MPRRKMGDYGGAGSSAWFNEVNKQLGQQLEGPQEYSSEPLQEFQKQFSTQKYREESDAQTKDKRREKVIEELGGDGGGGGGAGGGAPKGPRGGGDIDLGGEGTDPLMGGFKAGLTTGLATFNPWLAGASALFGYFQAKENRKKAEEERQRQLNNQRELRKMQARSEFAGAMRTIYTTQASRRLNL